MRFKTEQYDAIARRLLDRNPNMLVPWWLMASHAYYDLDDPFLSDDCYDLLTRQLDERWDEIEHSHKHLIDRDALKAGTGYQLAGKMPSRIVDATRHLMNDYTDISDIGPKPKSSLSIDDLLGEPSGIDDLL